MTPRQADFTILNANLDPKDFWKWMENQTVAMDEKGETTVYDQDVFNFIKKERREPIIWD